MKNLSKWAANNPLTSQIIIIVSGFALSAIAYLFANILYFEGIVIPLEYMYILIPIAVLSMIFYPIKYASKGIFKSTYLKRKSMDAVLILVGFLMILVFDSQLTHETTLETATQKTNSYAQLTSYAPNAAPVAKKSWRGRVINKFKKLNRKWVKPLKRSWKKSSKGEAIGKIIFLIIALLIIGALTLFLACNLSCSGANAAAILLLVLGGALLILIIAAIRRILKKNMKDSKKRPKKEEPIE